MKKFAVVVLSLVLAFSGVAAADSDDFCVWNEELNTWDCEEEVIGCEIPYMYLTEEFLYTDGFLMREIVYSECNTVLSCNRAYGCENGNNCQAYTDYINNILLPCN
jgi:hypothetical protein